MHICLHVCRKMSRNFFLLIQYFLLDVSVQFTQSDFVFFESDGTVSIGVEITSSIAQQLSVFVSGG